MRVRVIRISGRKCEQEEGEGRGKNALNQGGQKRGK